MSTTTTDLIKGMPDWHEIVSSNDKILANAIDQTQLKIGDLSVNGLIETDLATAIKNDREQLSDIVYNTAPNGADQTTDLNNYFNILSDKGIKYAVFNKVGEYIANGDLTNAYKVLKIGNARINKANTDNWFINIINSYASFSEKINSQSIQNMKSNIDNGSFKQFTTALSQNRPIKICFIGDSITAGSDQTSDFSTRVTKYNGMSISTDGITTDNSYTYKIINSLKGAFPNTTFEMNNYAVGGTRIDSWDSTVTYWGVTKKWIDFCKDSHPDVLVVGFGMNNNNFDNARLFANDLKSLIDYVNANFSPIPDIVVVTSPRCINVAGHVDWGNYENQGGRFMAQNVARSIAKEYGAYVMDVGRLSDIKRVGLDYTKPIFKRLSISDFQEVFTNVTKNADGSYIFGSESWNSFSLINNYQKDFTLKLKLRFETSNANASNMLLVSFNKAREADFYENRVTITPKSVDNFAHINTYLRCADYPNWSGSGDTTLFTDTESYEGKDITLIISKRAEKVEIRKLNSYGYEDILIEDYADSWDVHGYFDFRYIPANTGDSLIIKSIEINGAEYPQYIPKITENEMFGGFVDGDYSTKMPYGGSGANHPSSIGISEVYEPAIDEMVKDIVLTVNNNNRNNMLSVFQVTETKHSDTASSTLSYITVNTKILSARLVASDGTVYKLNKNITAWAGYTVGGTLGANEFGMFMQNDSQAMILINSPTSDGWTITTYQ